MAFAHEKILLVDGRSASMKEADRNDLLAIIEEHGAHLVALAPAAH